MVKARLRSTLVSDAGAQGSRADPSQAVSSKNLAIASVVEDDEDPLPAAAEPWSKKQ